MKVGGPGVETAIIGLAGGAFRVGELELPGRASVWDGLPSAVYLPPGVTADRRGLRHDRGGAGAGVGSGWRRRRRFASVRRRCTSRSAVPATRRARSTTSSRPDFPADRLEVVEVYTPSGNWSSWPPHKHDTDDMPREAILEEVYHYRFRRPQAWACSGCTADRARAVARSATARR